MLWLSAQEIADAAASGVMPGLPTTKRRVNALADREGWADTPHCRVREGREGGGGLEYHVDVLPVGARTVWMGHNLSIEAHKIRPVVRDTKLDELGDARTILLELAYRLRCQTMFSQTAADALFCEMYEAGSIAVPGWISARIKSLSPRTLSRWRSAVQKGEETAKRGRRKGSGILDTADGGKVRALILAAFAKNPFLRPEHLRILVKDKYGEMLSSTCPQTGEVKTVPLPSLRTFQASFARWKEEYHNELLRITDPDKYRSTVRFSATGSQTAERLNECWQLDASPADVMLKGGRHSIYMSVDVYSRRAIILVSKTPRASAVGLLIRKCIMAWGVPEILKTDNGSDFIANQTKRLFNALDIEVDLSPVYTPEDKGIVERAIGTFQRDLVVCPGFIGHSVADRKKIENRKSFDKRLGATIEALYDVDMDFAEFQDWCDVWAADMYGRDQHSALGKRTPFDVAASYAGTVKKIEHEAALDVLLAPIASGNGLRRVTKQGVRVDGAAYLPMNVLPGTEVFVRMDPGDLGRIMLFDPETEGYLGEALNAELAGLNPGEVAAKAKAMQKAYEDEKLADMRRASRKIGKRDVADAMRRDAAERSGILAFPKAGETYVTPALNAAAEASFETPSAPEQSNVSDQAVAAFRDEHRTTAEVVQKPETPDERFRRFRALEKRIEAGETIPADQQARLEQYKAQPEYRARMMVLEDFSRNTSG